jgi:dTDP-4-dehydrorhamnose reductase
VDRAESEPEAAHVINTLAPGVLARQAARAGAWLVHYSTDYVFDGTGEISWQETDLPDPRSVYGRTKLHGEEAIRASGCRHLIFRTSWVYATRGHNFAKTMLRLAQERDVLTVVDDQVGAPTGADLIADVTAHSIRMAMRQPDVSGLYHLAASGQTSWYEYARLVLEQARQSRPAQVDAIKVAPDAIHPIPSDAFPVPAERPKNSRLDTRKLTATFDLQLPAWQGGVKRMLAEILNDQRFEI